MKQLLYIIAFVCLLHQTAVVQLYAQHTPLLSQYLFNKPVMNPAYVGMDKMLSATVLYKKQWVNFDGAPQTGTVNIHGPIPNRNIGVGLNILQDRIGITSLTDISAAYSYKINFKESVLAMGLQAGVSVYKYNWADIQTAESGDEAFTGAARAVVPKFGAGIIYSRKDWELGFSIPEFAHLTSSSEGVNRSVIQNPMLTYFEYRYQAAPNVKLFPALLFKMLDRDRVQVDINARAELYEKVSFGVSYRTQDAVVLMTLFKIDRKVFLGYAYDHTLSPLGQYNKGSHEVIFKYLFNFEVKAADVITF